MLSPRGTGSYLRAFADPARAEECLAALDRAERSRRDVNPFDYSADLEGCTGFPPAILRDWLLEADVTPPEVALEWPSTWRDWWTVIADHLTELQVARCWQAMDKVRFFRLVELDWRLGRGTPRVKRKAYLVRHCLYTGRNDWGAAELDDEALYAYPSRSLAEGECGSFSKGNMHVGGDGYSAWVIVELDVEE